MAQIFQNFDVLSGLIFMPIAVVIYLAKPRVRNAYAWASGKPEASPTEVTWVYAIGASIVGFFCGGFLGPVVFSGIGGLTTCIYADNVRIDCFIEQSIQRNY